MRPIAALLLLALAGCSITPPEYSSSAPVEQQTADRYQCEKDASTAGRACPRAALFMKCMAAKGYRQVPETGNMWRCNLD